MNRGLTGQSSHLNPLLRPVNLNPFGWLGKKEVPLLRYADDEVEFGYGSIKWMINIYIYMDNIYDK